MTTSAVTRRIRLTPVSVTTICFLVLMLWSLSLSRSPLPAHASTGPRRINAPYFSGSLFKGEEAAVFWYGQVNSTSNSTDVRLGYNDDVLQITLHTIDRKLWNSNQPTPDQLTDWDAVSVFLHLAGNSGSNLTNQSYRYVAQQTQKTPRTQYQAVFQWNGSDWAQVSSDVEITSGWRGNYPNDIYDDRGWHVKFRIPYSDFGLTGPPPAGTVWGLALTTHDRDDAAGTFIPDQIWPETQDWQQPSTWGQLVFGQPNFTPDPAIPGNIVTIRHGLNGANVPDAHVGGHTTCGDGLDHWTEWGYANYAGYNQINIQNQWDIADYSCFSKYFVTFPLNSLPTEKVIISATLTMYQFGNSNPYAALPSYIQVLTVADDWNEATINWNNAPLVLENVSAAWVDPLLTYPGTPGVPRQWDVSRAVAEAYANGTPLRLALYSADGERHSGKYFRSSDAGANARPRLEVLWGDPIFGVSASPGVQRISTGGTADYAISIQYSQGYSGTVQLDTGSPPAGLTVDLAPPTSFNPPGGQTDLTLTDQHSPPYSAGLWYVLPLNATDGNITQTSEVRLLINGHQVFLPLVCH